MTTLWTPRRKLAIAALLAAALASGCSDQGTPPSEARDAGSTAKSAPARPQERAAGASARPAAPVTVAGAQDLVEQGRQAYLSSCIACHNADPTQDGALGPAIAGSSRELVEARVMRGEYPEGYVPKRKTAVMVAMPFLEKQIPAIAAFLAASGG